MVWLSDGASVLALEFCCPCGGLLGCWHSTGSSEVQVGRGWCDSVRKGEETQTYAIHAYTSMFSGKFLAVARPCPINGKACLMLGCSLPSLNVLCAFPEVPSLDSASVSVIPGGQVSWVPVLSAAPSGSSPCCCCPR